MEDCSSKCIQLHDTHPSRSSVINWKAFFICLWDSKYCKNIAHQFSVDFSNANSAKIKGAFRSNSSNIAKNLARENLTYQKLIFDALSEN